MLLAVVSDIHANFEAWKAVEEDLRQFDARSVIQLGDVVGYGPDPSACIRRLRSLKAIGVRGNHDELLVSGQGGDSFHPAARAIIDWTRSALEPAELEWLSALPRIRKDARVCLAHSTPADPSGWSYVDTKLDIERAFDACASEVVFVGHTHVPMAAVRSKDGGITISEHDVLRWSPGERVLANPGSVGQPRDENAEAAYILFDARRRQMVWRRVPYDVGATQARMRRFRFPLALSERLSGGY